MKGSPAKRLANGEGAARTTPPQTAAEVLSKHVVLEVESIDRMYLNVIVGRLQILEGALRFIRQQRKAQVLSTDGHGASLPFEEFRRLAQPQCPRSRIRWPYSGAPAFE